MSEQFSNININIKGNADGSVFVVGDGNTIYNTSPPGEPDPFGVPYQRNRYFIGREAILKQLHEQLTQPTATAINTVQAIRGLGGIGKTQTAVEYAYRHHYDKKAYDQVFWIKADTKASIVTDFAQIAIQLALPVAQSTQEVRIPAVKTWLAHNFNWLLIFDNADSPHWLTDYIPSNPHGKILITSRARIFDQVGIRQPLVLDVLPEPEAIAMLFMRTEYNKTEENVAAAIEINQELDGLPLALEQASAYINACQPPSFVSYLKTYRKQGISQLGEDLALAQTGKYTSSILKTWSINFKVVSKKEPATADLLKISALLAPNDIPYRVVLLGASHIGLLIKSYLERKDRDADEMITALGKLLGLLSQFSLVRWEPKRQVYSMHRLVQAVVRDKMTKKEEKDYLKRVANTIFYAYPGQKFQHWEICGKLMPHWLKIIEESRQNNVKSEALGSIMNQASLYLQSQGRYLEAESICEQALGIRQDMLGENHPEVAESLNNLAQIYRKEAKYKDAELLFRKSLSISLSEENQSDVAITMNNLALSLCDQEKIKQAEALFLRAIEIYKRNGRAGEFSEEKTKTLNNLAYCYAFQGKNKKAESLWLENLSARREIFGEEHPAVAESLNNLAWFYNKRFCFYKAEPYFLEALKIRTNLLGKNHPEVAQSMINLGVNYAGKNGFGKAEGLISKGIEILKKTLNESHPRMRKIRTSLKNIQEKRRKINRSR